MGTRTTQARRTDAQRNRAQILAAAREALLEDGNEPSLAEIARRAGVGMATLYRNFAGRRELVEELYRTQIDDICAAAASVSEDTPGRTLFAWLRAFQAAGARKGALASLLLADPGAGSPVFNESRARVVAAGQPLFLAATNSGEVRDDVALGEILDGVVVLARIPVSAASPSPLVEVLLDGLRRS